ncbi:hypothetical protein [Clostridium tarantellae]|uniref:Uncharacterized protein n=1 Tax=Clostridium tarantellae TaxID=39493 RepID=A0A6I1MQ70_9CLOT|nr:hypothetical protein [Clostridium tarantellae]MPQ44287.1 hypothetical protein [Clostridium tarantellae]
MKHSKNKIIGGLMALLFIIAIGFTIKSNIVTVNNKTFMKKQSSSLIENKKEKNKSGFLDFFKNIISHKKSKGENNQKNNISVKQSNKDGNSKDKKDDAISSASKEKEKNTVSEIKPSTFINKAIDKSATKIVDLGWIKYIVATFNEGTIKDYDLYVLDGENYKAIKPSNVDDSGKIVKWEIDKLGYNTIKIKNKNSGEEGIYKFEK